MDFRKAMGNRRFDKALSEFLDDAECEKVHQALYDLVCSAFAAGWKAGRKAESEIIEIESMRKMAKEVKK